jgi:ABC-type polysaccharide/polyol phosphate transport system ATPase subunit
MEIEVQPEHAIVVERIGKAYRLWDSPSARLTVPLLEGAAQLARGMSWLNTGLRAKASGLYRDFWALNDISFQVHRGESMAIIGRNGSGKSTLLQIIAGTLRPTAGSVRVNGRIATLLELGSGFNPEFTGRENIHLNATLFGLSREEIDARFADIASFADIGDFIEQPVKIYSSGMVVRLAFAVAAHIDPDILIVDEALSVGDARFQLKCARAIDRFLARGVTLLFVSHDTSMIKRLCKRAILLERGQLIYAGNPNDVVNLYSKLIAEGGSLRDLESDIAGLNAAADSTSAAAAHPPAREAPPTTPPPIPPAGEPPNFAPSAEVDALRLRIKALETLLSDQPDNPVITKRLAELLQNERLHVQVSGKEFSYGGDLGRILSVATLDSDGQPRTWFASCEPVTVRMLVEAREDFPEPIFALTIKNIAGVEIYGTNTLYSKQPAPALKAGTRREINFSFDLKIMPGHYFISVGFTQYVGNELVVVHRRYDTIKIEVHGSDRAFGVANLQAGISSKDLPPSSPG